MELVDWGVVGLLVLGVMVYVRVRAVDERRWKARSAALYTRHTAERATGPQPQDWAVIGQDFNAMVPHCTCPECGTRYWGIIECPKCDSPVRGN